MLKQRMITAIILIAATLAILFYSSSPVFCVLTACMALAAAWEWTNLMSVQRISGRLLYLISMAFLFFGALFVPIALILCLTFIWWLLATALIVVYPRGSSLWGKGPFLRAGMGVAVLLPCWAAINYIRNQSDGIYALLFLFVLIWGADSAAYFTGKKWGKNKLAPHVSPGKSIQGLFGAIIFSILVTLLALLESGVAYQGWPWVIALSLVTVLFSIVGDLFESMLKRRVSLKDSGRLLPGHGGLLDRIDSLTAAAPVFAFGALLLGTYL
jgi:phosphatidate cytidylyltransferase